MMILKYSYLFYVLYINIFTSVQGQYTKKGNNLVKYYCFKSNKCAPGGKVCGYDEDNTFLAEFKDICMFYRINCRGPPVFSLVENIICETQMKYDREHGNETFEWVHIRNSSAVETTRLPVVVTKPKRSRIVPHGIKSFM